MTLRPEYALGHSALNAFLFAPAGKDEEGQDLTVLSVLARAGLDPWAEAARLADLPKETAVQGVAALLFGETRKTTDADNVATRLVDLLPRHIIPPIPTLQSTSVATMKSRPSIWLFCLAVAVVWFLFLSYMKADPQLEPGGSDVTQQ